MRSEIGRLQRVLPRFIVVSGQYFVAKNLTKIILTRPCRRQPTCRVVVRTTDESVCQLRLVQIGRDFVEAIETAFCRRRRVLIPLRQVVSIEPT